MPNRPSAILFAPKGWQGIVTYIKPLLVYLKYIKSSERHVIKIKLHALRVKR